MLLSCLEHTFNWQERGICVNSCLIWWWAYGYSLYPSFHNYAYFNFFSQLMFNKNRLQGSNQSLLLHSEEPAALSLGLLQGFAPSPVAGDPGLWAPHWASRARRAICIPNFPQTELGTDVEVGVVEGEWGCGEVLFGQSGFGTSQVQQVTFHPHRLSQTVFQDRPPGAEPRKPFPLWRYLPLPSPQ